MAKVESSTPVVIVAETLMTSPMVIRLIMAS